MKTLENIVAFVIVLLFLFLIHALPVAIFALFVFGLYLMKSLI